MSLITASHLPVLQVIAPMLLAPFCIVIGNRTVARGFMLIAAIVMFGISVALMAGTLDGYRYTYELGGWAAPWGIEYVVDPVTAFVLLTINLVHLLAAIYCLSGNRPAGNHDTPDATARPSFFAAWLLCICGLNGMVVTNDAFNLFVFLEISSLATYVLISCGRDHRALLAAYRYLIMGAVGATFVLLSVGLLYMQTGTLNISDLADRIADKGADRTIIMALSFFVIGIGIKCAIFPLHDWLPNAYNYAPDSVTVLLSGTATKVALYVLLRFLHDLFSADFSILTMPLDWVLIICGILGMLIPPLIALRESSLKRMFAWSSVAQISYIVVGVGLGTTAGAAAALLHLFNHSIIKAMIFMAVGILIARTGTARIKHLGSVAHHHRFACYILLFGGLSLIGLPGTTGFVSKWVLVTAVIDKGSWWLTIPVLAGSLASASYVWRIVEVLWAKPVHPELDAQPTGIHFVEWFPLLILTALAVWFGLNATWLTGVADLAASSLVGTGIGAVR